MARIENDYMEVDWIWDDFKKNVVIRLINNWIIENEIFDAESLFQMDKGLIESPALVADILEALQIEVWHK